MPFILQCPFYHEVFMARPNEVQITLDPKNPMYPAGQLVLKVPQKDYPDTSEVYRVLRPFRVDPEDTVIGARMIKELIDHHWLEKLTLPVWTTHRYDSNWAQTVIHEDIQEA
jgi:hypothetical protein